MVFLTCSVSFRSISCRYFSKWRLKIFSGGNHPLPLEYDGLPYPRVRGYARIFFHQNYRKGCKRDYLDARGHFVLCFGAIGDKPLGGDNHPLRNTRLKLTSIPIRRCVPSLSGEYSSSILISSLFSFRLPTQSLCVWSLHLID